MRRGGGRGGRRSEGWSCGSVVKELDCVWVVLDDERGAVGGGFFFYYYLTFECNKCVIPKSLAFASLLPYSLT